MLVGMCLLRLICLLPYRWLMALGRGLGRVLYRGLSSRRRVAKVNLELTHPQLSDQARGELLRASFQSLGCMVFEAGLAWWSSNRRIAGLSEVEGQEHLLSLLNEGQGVLLVSAHFTTLEIGTRILCDAIPGQIAGLYRKHGSAALDTVVRGSRLRYAANLFNRSQTRQAVRHMRQGHALWYAADQDYGRGDSIFVPYLGVIASTITSTHHLARMGKARVIMVSQQRLPDHRGYRLVFSRPLEGVPSQDIEADTLRINQQLDQMVLANPEQYLWIHRRFKTRPEGQASLY
jgi:KDO2-lipid IV(A) lauroyltransferase